MAERKQGAAAPSKTQPGAAPAPSEAPAGASTGTKPGRKAWVKKTPVEHVLAQIGKQEKKVADMREELKNEERELAKLQQAKKLLEGT